MINFTGPEWASMKAMFEEELARRHKQLKSPKLPHDVTQVVRGRIADLEFWLALPERMSRPQTVKDRYDDDDY